jgi:two-component system NarL family sensor kinase
MLRRLPLESDQPVVAFAAIRLFAAIGALILAAALGFPYGGRLGAVLGGVAVPWGLAMFVLARRSSDAALNPLVAAGDIAVLLAVELVVPETTGATRSAALFFIAVHSHFQGEGRGLAMAVGAAGVLIVGSEIRGDTPEKGDTLAFYEAAFAVAALGTGLIVGRLRTAESASRLRARGLTRRTIEAEREVRRRVAEAIHDGPVQELIGLDMVLSAAHQAAGNGDSSRVEELIDEAKTLTERNVQVLRDEIVDLGPYAFEELTFDVAIGNCLSVWRRRYDFEVLLALEPVELEPDVAADLFAITQEAVTNVGRHADASTVSISVRTLDGTLELRVADDGDGFGDLDPLGPSEPGHLGLASMRERAELLDGDLEIETSEKGTRLLVRVPLARRGRLGRRGARLGTRD